MRGRNRRPRSVTAKVYKELSQAVEEWIEVCEQDGVPLPEATAGREYSGKFVIRVGKDLHKTLAIGALRRGQSLNEYCVHLLREGKPAYGKRKGDPHVAPRARPSRKR